KEKGDFVMDLAEQDPGLLGMSIVFRWKHEEQKDEDGKPAVDARGGKLPMLARVDELRAADVVDEPAANPNGMFSRSREGLAHKITAFLDRYVADKVHQWARGNGSEQNNTVRESEETPSASLAQPQEDSMSDENKTQDAMNAAIQAERHRVNEIRKCGAKLGARPELIDELIDQEVPLADALSKICMDEQTGKSLHKTQVLHTLESGGNHSAGGAGDVTAPRKPADDAPVEERARFEWDRNRSLQKEFGKFETYLAFKKAEENNLVFYSKAIPQDFGNRS
ncbi:MAG: hypothetical protein KC940_14000, partial [Candidatus Omnitrophica bacterium]|nr:hypothetical protein [Candidatus Omnitrophota bacterium]